MIIPIKNCTEYRVLLVTPDHTEVLFESASLQLAATKLRELAAEYEVMLREAAEQSVTCFLRLAVRSYASNEAVWLTICRITAVIDEPQLWMI